ncbi:protein translocase subunit SecD [Candidatus Falkowbacteria bacterium]|nr:protein translocase subunit SecD [Candidatus Falkowbacteria bacterium]
MAKQPFQNFFTPGPRGKLRWLIFGIVILFIFTFFIDVFGFKNIAAQKLDQGLSAIPMVSDWRIWPKIEKSPLANTKGLRFKNIKEIDLINYGLPFSLGLDLLGGTHLVYDANVSQIDLSERADALGGVRDVIERRVNALGVSEPLVQTNQVGSNWRVIVELAGVYDVNQAIKMIGETPLLEFKEENPAASQLTPQEQQQLDRENKAIEVQAQAVLPQILAGADFAKLAKQYSDDPGSKDNGGLYRGVKKGAFVPEFDDVAFNKLKVGEIYPDLIKTQFGYHIIKKEAEKGEGDNKEVDVRHILFQTKTAADLGLKINSEWKNTGLTGQQLKKATVEFDPNSGVPQVGLEFNSEGAKLFADITTKNTGKPVAIFLDGSPISIPRVNEPILSGKAVISGSFTTQEAKLLAQRLNAGALPVPINLISQTTVGASLGNESVQRSLQAGVFGLLLVVIFMILYYRLPGVLSVIALFIYTTIALALFKFFHITLTLAGIAGFILSVGMAVDANILIFERLKEELRAGKDLAAGVKEGFHRAWFSIRDSNVSSLITCVILYWFGSSIIKGFALTLAIGILVSMFSAITITRQFLRLVSGWRPLQHRWLYGVRKKQKDTAILN